MEAGGMEPVRYCLGHATPLAGIDQGDDGTTESTPGHPGTIGTLGPGHIHGQVKFR